VYGRMQALPSFKPQIRQEGASSSLEKEHKPFTSFNACSHKGH
nr:hypothetical protein [Tanacetum cinerariifolium]